RDAGQEPRQLFLPRVAVAGEACGRHPRDQGESGEPRRAVAAERAAVESARLYAPRRRKRPRNLGLRVITITRTHVLALTAAASLTGMAGLDLLAVDAKPASQERSV